MAHGTNPLVDTLKNVPALVQSLRRDPGKLLTSLVKCDQGQAAIRAGAQLIGDIFAGYTSSSPAQGKPSVSLLEPGFELSNPLSSQGNEPLSTDGGSSSVRIIGITSLAVITGSMALLGTVAMVALNGRGE